eukprot:365126-Chlamydomonas_euryale.AAC.58
MRKHYQPNHIVLLRMMQRLKGMTARRSIAEEILRRTNVVCEMCRCHGVQPTIGFFSMSLALSDLTSRPRLHTSEQKAQAEENAAAIAGSAAAGFVWQRQQCDNYGKL